MSSMLKLLLVGIKGGQVTLKYPIEVSAPKGLRGKPELNFDTCIGCGACAKTCPSNAITVEEVDEVWTLRLFYGLCIMCAICEEVCPVDAFRFCEDFELASTNREDLQVELQLLRVKCKSCGKYFTTKRLLENTLAEYLELESIGMYVDGFKDAVYECQDCRKENWVDTLAVAYRRARFES